MFKVMVFLVLQINMVKKLGEELSKKTMDLATSKIFKDTGKKNISTAGKILINKTAEATGDLIGKKIADKTTNIGNVNAKNNNDKKLKEQSGEELEEIYISPEKRAEIIEKLCLF